MWVDAVGSVIHWPVLPDLGSIALLWLTNAVWRRKMYTAVDTQDGWGD